MRLYSGKRPIMFYQPGDESMKFKTFTNGDRVRIFYPDGHCEWMTFGKGEQGERFEFNEPPCWYYHLRNKTGKAKPSNMKEALAFARKFDKNMDFPAMELLGEL